MNLILFEPGEIGAPLDRRDPRAVHLLKVLRKRPGDRFDAGVLGEGIGEGRIEGIGAGGDLVFSIDITEPPPPRLPLRVAVGFPRPIQLRRILRDLSCMGAAAVDLAGTDLGEKSYRDTKLLDDGGARAALREGAEQSRDALLPSLRVFSSLDRWLLELPRGEGALLVAADNVRPQGSMARLEGGFAEAVVAVGPERGWSDRERGLLDEAGFMRLSMGARAMRTETACVSASALALEKIGAFG